MPYTPESKNLNTTSDTTKKILRYDIHCVYKSYSLFFKERWI